MPLIFANLDHRRRIVLLDHPTLQLLTQTSSVFFHYCSFLNDFLFLALVVKPVIYLSNRRRKNIKKPFFILFLLLRLSLFAFWKRLLEMTRGRIYFDNERRRDMQYWISAFLFFIVCYYALTRLDAIILKILGIFWILENKRQTWQQHGQVNDVVFFAFFYVPCKKWIAGIPSMNRIFR